MREVQKCKSLRFPLTTLLPVLSGEPPKLTLALWRTGEVLLRYEERPHTLVSRRRVERHGRGLRRRCSINTLGR